MRNRRAERRWDLASRRARRAEMRASGGRRSVMDARISRTDRPIERNCGLVALRRGRCELVRADRRLDLADRRAGPLMDGRGR